ncbi:MAG: hypothetical protein AAF950_17525 [Pseudomonadota bacterium]
MSSDSIAIYLSGSVKKGSVDVRGHEHFWTEEDEINIRKNLNRYSVHLLNPSKTKITRNDVLNNFGCDLYLVRESDVVFVDARNKRGIGIGAEMMYASVIDVPVISICPKNSYYRKDFVPDVFGEDLHDWIHPFIAGLSNVVVDSIDAAVEVVKQHFPTNFSELATPKPESAIQYFLDRNRGNGYLSSHTAEFLSEAN